MPEPDADVIPWVVEFLLRQPLPSSLTKPLLRSCLPSSLSPRLTKTLLLRRLSDDLSFRLLSSVTLHSLELLADSSDSSPLLSAAYSAVAVHLTVKPLKDSSISDFFEAVNRIWNRGVADLEACSGKRKGLVSTGLREARREMEAAVLDPAVREELVGRETEGRALEALRECLEEVEKELGPTFLELAAEAFRAESKGKNLEAQLDRPLGESSGKVEALRAGRCEKGDGLLGSDDRAENIHAKLDLKQTSSLYRVKGIGHSENTNVADGKNNDNDAVFEHEHMDKERSNLKDVEQTQKGVFVKSNFGFAGRDIEDGNCDKATFAKRDGNCGALRRPSIMERNPTAHTYEWDDSFQSPFASNPPEELHFSSPKNGKPSLDVEDNMQFILRKRRKKWSPLEEETLRKAVERHGAGRWKFIKNCHPKIFKDRTEVDLKDKWRNLMRQY
ncbi:uncharacterized protein [Typha angustifolia]|uniref:uncharacterized protein n=1 Tax=Typha angustifolia TaxID=59011 RepID=UPI003C2AB82A